VFEVEDPQSALDEVLVLKRLHPEMSARATVRAAFAREAETLKELSHPDLVCFRRCFFDDEKRICLLMERVEGQTLGAWSSERGADVEAHLQLFDRILGAVDYLHHQPRPLLHLDLKPDNILVRETSLGPRPTLIDFGIARGLGEGGLKAYTEPYGAPEQLRGRELGCFTDVHALGHVLASLLDRVRDRLEPSRRAALEKVVAVATHASRRRRYADAAAMRRAFREAKAVCTTESSSPGRPWGRWAAVVLPALILGAVGTLLLPEGGEPTPRSTSAISSEAIEEFHAALEGALRSTNHAAIEQHFDEARRILVSDEVTPEARLMLRNTLAEVRRIVNRPVVTDSDRQAASRWLSEQVHSVSRREVAQ